MKKSLLATLLLVLISSLSLWAKVNIPTVITTQPILADSYLCPGENFSLSVIAEGDNLTYQWQKDAIDLAGETSSTLDVSSVTVVDAGAYTVIVTGDNGSETSNPVFITIGNDTEIVEDPLSVNVCELSNASFGVTAEGDNITYQWYKNNFALTNGGKITGTNTTSLNIDPVVLSDAGNYIVVVTGECGTVTSEVATLDITSTEIPVVRLDVDEATICIGKDVTFTATGGATGIMPLYEFRIAGTTNVLQAQGASNTYSTTGGVTTDLSVEVIMTSNSMCIDPAADNPVMAEQGVTVITSTESPTVTLNVDQSTICEGEDVIFTATGAATGSMPLYEFRKAGTNTILQAQGASNTYSTTGGVVSDLQVEVIMTSNSVCIDPSANNPVTAEQSVTVISSTESPTVTLNVDQSTICEGEDVTFTATGAGTGSMLLYEFREAVTGTVIQPQSPSNTYTTSGGVFSDLSIEVIMTSNSVCIDPSANTSVTAEQDVTVITVPSVVITLPQVDTYYVAQDHITLETINPGLGYTIEWQKINTAQQGVLTSPQSDITDLVSLTTIEPDPITGVGTTDIVVEISDNGHVCSPARDTVTIIRKGITIPFIADAEICVTESPYTIVGNPLIPIFEAAVMIDLDDASGNGLNSRNYGTSLELLSLTTLLGETEEVKDFRFTYEIVNSISNTTLTDDAIIKIHNTSSIANAGNDIITCAESVTLNAEVPVIGSGEWSCNAGTLSDPTSPTSQLSGLIQGQEITCSWTVGNGVCQSSVDNVTITRSEEVTSPTIYLDNIDVTGETIDLCITDLVSLRGESPTQQETGVWSIVSGTSVTGVTGTTPELGILNLVSAGTTEIHWTLDNSVASCFPEAGSVTLIIHEEPIANIINLSSSDTCVGANVLIETEPVGAGDIVNWTGDILPENPSANKWLVDAFDLVVGENEITFVVENIGCSSKTQTKTIRVSAGPDIEIQNLVNGEITSNSINSILLEATHTGISSNWSSADGDFVTIDDPTSLFTNASIEWNKGTSVTFTANDGKCEASKTVNIRTNDPLGLNQVISQSGNSTFFIEGLGNYDDVQLFIYTLEGKMITQDFLNEETTWEAHSLSSGLYIYKLTYDNQSQSMSGKIQVVD